MASNRERGKEKKIELSQLTSNGEKLRNFQIAVPNLFHRKMIFTKKKI